MKKPISLLIFTGFAAFIGGCVTSLHPGAANIIVTTQPVPSSCSNLGIVASDSRNGSTHMYTSHQNIETSQINVLKNIALDLGANVVVITHHFTTYQYVHRGYTRVDIHAMSGNAYSCPSAALAGLAQQDMVGVSDR